MPIGLTAAMLVLLNGRVAGVSGVLGGCRNRCEVQDWSGGTRISECLHQFKQRWASRVLSGRATVLLISDGLEHGTPEDPRCKQCQPRAAGIQAMLPFVDRFLPAHNLVSLQALAQVLAGRS